MTLQTEMLTLGMIQTNCYIIADSVTHDAAIIDPADNAPQILEVVRREGFTVRDILITHAHFDHILALGDVKAATGATIRMHAADMPILESLPMRMQQLFNMSVPPAPMPDVFINEGDLIKVGNIEFEVRFTPGHAPGHVAFINHEYAVAFSGDCLFAGSIGRTDLPGADYKTLMHSIFGKLLTLPDDYTIAPGHMQTTTVGRERASNPFLLDWMGS